MTNIAQQFRSGPSSAILTAEEQTLLRMLADGLAKLYRRFGVNMRMQLLSYAIRNGLVRQH